jgi:hypothetical protein
MDFSDLLEEKEDSETLSEFFYFLAFKNLKIRYRHLKLIINT